MAKQDTGSQPTPQATMKKYKFKAGINGKSPESMLHPSLSVAIKASELTEAKVDALKKEDKRSNIQFVASNIVEA